jgi:hypothetical protein
MDQRKFREQDLAKAQRELDAATKLAEVKAAAKRPQRARAALKELGGSTKRSKRQPPTRPA